MILALASVDAQGFDIQKLLKNNGATNSNNGGTNSILNSIAGNFGGSKNSGVSNTKFDSKFDFGGLTGGVKPAKDPESRKTTTETTVTDDSTTTVTDSTTVTDDSITDKTELQEPTDRNTVMKNKGDNSKSPNPTQPTNPGWELKGKNPDAKDWETTGDTNDDWKHVTNGDTSVDGMDGYGREDLKSVGMMDPKYREMEMHEKKMKSKKEDMAAVEKSIGDLEEKMMMQAFEFGFGFILHNMNVIMEQIEPAVLRFNSMLKRYGCFQIFN